MVGGPYSIAVPCNMVEDDPRETMISSRTRIELTSTGFRSPGPVLAFTTDEHGQRRITKVERKCLLSPVAVVRAGGGKVQSVEDRRANLLKMGIGNGRIVFQVQVQSVEDRLANLIMREKRTRPPPGKIKNRRRNRKLPDPIIINVFEYVPSPEDCRASLIKIDRFSVGEGDQEVDPDVCEHMTEARDVLRQFRPFEILNAKLPPPSRGDDEDDDGADDEDDVLPIGSEMQAIYDTLAGYKSDKNDNICVYQCNVLAPAFTRMNAAICRTQDKLMQINDSGDGDCRGSKLWLLKRNAQICIHAVYRQMIRVARAFCRNPEAFVEKISEDDVGAMYSGVVQLLDLVSSKAGQA